MTESPTSRTRCGANVTGGFGAAVVAGAAAGVLGAGAGADVVAGGSVVVGDASPGEDAAAGRLCRAARIDTSPLLRRYDGGGTAVAATSTTPETTPANASGVTTYARRPRSPRRMGRSTT